MISWLRKLNSKYKIKARFLEGFYQLFCRVFFLSWPNSWSSGLASRLQDLKILQQGKKQYQYIANNPLLLWRAQTLFSKEPETIDWLNSLPEGDVLFDVGANVGIYSVYAGLHGLKVYSFEPEASNYGILNRNIMVNQLSDQVRAYCLALGDQESFDSLRLTNLLPGSAHTTFGENEQFRQVSDPTVFQQGCFCSTLDDLVTKYHFPIPQHLKIDVDGIEAKIIKGAKQLLSNRKLKSILIELNEDMEEDRWIKTELLGHGFKVHAQSSGALALKNKMQLRDYVFTRS